MPAIDRLMRRAGLRPGDLRGGAVAVSIGPGGFTGLRIATATAKMLGETLGAALVAVPSALVAAEASSLAGSIAVALACKGTGFWLTRVKKTNGWVIDGTPGLVDAASFSPAGLTAALADEFLPDEAARRCDEAGVPIVALTLTPQACLSIGGAMWREGRTVGAPELSPLYARQPEAAALWAARAASRSSPPVQ
jgi:tRNA threonylcarbamoyl adenosine modification protein YeaZ